MDCLGKGFSVAPSSESCASFQMDETDEMIGVDVTYMDFQHMIGQNSCNTFKSYRINLPDC